MDFEVVAGDVHDSQSFHQLYEKMDLSNTKKLPAVAYTRPKTKDGFICPQNQTLKYTTTTREGYREYKSNPTI